MAHSLVWSKDAGDELLEIVAYQREKYGKKRAGEVYARIREKLNLLKTQSDIGRVVPELAELGVSEIRELMETPWRILYSVGENCIDIVSVIDGRRNLEEILYRKILDGKLV